MKKLFLLGMLITFISIPLAAYAIPYTIDFEGIGLTEGDKVTSVGDVSFTVYNGSVAYPIAAEVGNSLEVGFVPLDSPVGNVAGEFFITDGLDHAYDYAFRFNTWFSRSIALDLYDFRADGGGVVGGVATLTGYSDYWGTTPVGSTSYTIDGTEVDGNVVHLAINAPSDLIQTASLSFSDPKGLDVGVGVDNIQVDPVPEPTTLLLLGAGLLGLVGLGRKKFLKKG